MLNLSDDELENVFVAARAMAGSADSPRLRSAVDKLTAAVDALGDGSADD